MNIKRTLLLVLWCFPFSMLYVQAQEHVETNDSIYKMAEVAPTFGEGEADMFNYIAEHVVYPDSAIVQGAQGKVYCEFVVEKDGSLSNFKVVRSAQNEWLDKEAVRVISSMPHWKAGTIGGQPVRTRYFLPVTFKIQAPPPPPSNIVYDQVSYEETVMMDKWPEFPGGKEALFQFLSENVKYPSEAQKKGVQGKALVEFVIDKDGTITDIQIERSSGDHWLDREAIRVVHSMPNWKPGEKDGKVVRVRYHVPINFALTNDESKVKHTNAEKVLQDYLNKHFEYEPIKSGLNDIYALDITIPLRITVDSTGLIHPIALKEEISCHYKMINGREMIEENEGGQKVKTLSTTTFKDNYSLTAYVNGYCHNIKVALAEFIKTMDAAEIRCTPTKKDKVYIRETITVNLHRDGLKKYKVKK